MSTLSSRQLSTVTGGGFQLNSDGSFGTTFGHMSINTNGSISQSLPGTSMQITTHPYSGSVGVTVPLFKF